MNKTLIAFTTFLCLCLCKLAESQSIDTYSGTGFFVTRSGYFATNYHVVRDSESIVIQDRAGKKLTARVVRVDAKNDLALLKVEGSTFIPLSIANSQNVKRGARVATIGFPNIDVQGKEPKLSDGIVSSLSGIQDEPTVFQITIPIQPGNSGGPMVNMDGDVVGVVASKLSSLYMLATSGTVAENVNYAVKANYLAELLVTEEAAAKARPTSPRRKPKDLVELSETVEKSIALVIATRKLTDLTTLSAKCTENASNAKYADAVLACKEAAIRGDATSQQNLAQIYYNGSGVAQDYSEALKWSRLAATQLNARAQNFLGLAYFNGHGVVQDYVEATKWFRLAASQDFPLAQLFLGLIYYGGKGVSENHAEAVKWYKLAAAQGQSIAQTQLSMAYYYGDGVSRDRVRGFMWAVIAAQKEGESSKAAELRSMNGNGLTPEQRTTAQELVTACIARNYKECD